MPEFLINAEGFGQFTDPQVWSPSYLCLLRHFLLWVLLLPSQSVDVGLLVPRGTGACSRSCFLLSFLGKVSDRSGGEVLVRFAAVGGVVSISIVLGGSLAPSLPGPGGYSCASVVCFLFGFVALK